MTSTEIVEELALLISEGHAEVLSTKRQIEMGGTYVDRHKYDSWRAKCLHFLKLFLDEKDSFIENIESKKQNNYFNARSILITLNDITEYVIKGHIGSDNNDNNSTEQKLDIVFSNFHKVVRQLRDRYNDRPTLDVTDEYDVQDLLHALLRLFFDDIRPEEWTPSYAGKSARMDFLLKKEKYVIEVKKTRLGLTGKELGDQLIIDIDRYAAHADCKKLICFVYDPDGRIGNPEGIISDLSMKHKGFVDVVIKP